MSSESSPSDTLITLPIVTVQPTFLEVIDEVFSGIVPSEKFWISCYKTSEPSVHATVEATLHEVDRNRVLFHTKDVKIDKRGEAQYTVGCSSLKIPPTNIFVPTQEYKDPERSNPQHPHRITAFDIASDGSQFATGFLDGSIHIYPTTGPNKKSVSTSAHVSSVTSLHFFPSSRVLLSSGADFSLSILPANLLESGAPERTPISPVRTLRGHTRTITSTAIISRGRNILSASLDGTLRLWDVSSGEQIHVFVAGNNRYTPITAISLGAKELLNADGEPRDPAFTQSDPREVDTSNKLVFCALQDGSVEVFDVATKKSIFHSAGTNSPLLSIAYSDQLNLVATGSKNGIVTLYDSRELSVPLTSFTRNTAAIEDLVFTTANTSNGEEREVRLVIAAADGLAYIASVRPEGPGVVAELIGGDCDGVRAVRVGGKDGQEFVWSAGDDGVVRRFGNW